MSQSSDKPPLIAHIIFSLGVGGLENGLVNLINQMPPTKFRHCIICLKNATDFKNRLMREDVEVYELNKREGHDIGSFFTMYKLLKRLQPDIVHSRNLAAIEYQLPAFLAGIKYRIHGEHGWDVFDPDGNNKKYQKLRALMSLIIHRFVPLSRHLQDYLLQKVGIDKGKTFRICNGVDTNKFFPGDISSISDCPFNFDDAHVYFGTVGRMHGVKDQMNLVKAFVQVLQQTPHLKDSIRLVIIGDGPLHQQAIDYLTENSAENLAWLPGKRDDIADIMRCLDVFVLPSKSEGISNTILEALASGLPVIATKVGGNPELVEDGHCGQLVEKENSQQMADAIESYALNKALRIQQGENACQRVLDEFSIDVMVKNYLRLYQASPTQQIL